MLRAQQCHLCEEAIKTADHGRGVTEGGRGQKRRWLRKVWQDSRDRMARQVQCEPLPICRDQSLHQTQTELTTPAALLSTGKCWCLSSPLRHTSDLNSRRSPPGQTLGSCSGWSLGSWGRRAHLPEMAPWAAGPSPHPQHRPQSGSLPLGASSQGTWPHCLMGWSSAR